MLHDPVDDAVIGIGTAVDRLAGQALPALVAGDAQGDAVLGAELLELGHDARRDEDLALGVEGVHHALEELDFAGDGVGEEVGVDDDLVGGHEGGVVLEEHGGGCLGDGADCLGFAGQ